jgi:uncharacterized protein (DUF433 family)/DNA-binding transcriptional MerR regulator
MTDSRIAGTDPVFAFSAEQVRTLTGLSDRQLRYWDNTGFFSPSYGEVNRRRPFSRVYSFRDVVGLRAVAVLRSQLPLQQLRKVGAWLAAHYDEPWSSLRFTVAGREVCFREPGSGQWVSTRPPGQAVLRDFCLADVAAEMTDEAARLREREPCDVGRVVQNRFVMHNAPVLAGTRITTEAVWNFHVAGYSTDEIIQQYPRLTAADVQAAIAWESDAHNRAAS